MPFKIGGDHKKYLFLEKLKELLFKESENNTNNKSNSNKKKCFIKINGKNRLVYTGKLGGRYYIKRTKNKTKKIYIKDTKLIFNSNQNGGNNVDLSNHMTVSGLFNLSKSLKKN